MHPHKLLLEFCRVDIWCNFNQYQANGLAIRRIHSPHFLQLMNNVFSWKKKYLECCWQDVTLFFWICRTTRWCCCWLHEHQVHGRWCIYRACYISLIETSVPFFSAGRSLVLVEATYSMVLINRMLNIAYDLVEKLTILNQLWCPLTLTKIGFNTWHEHFNFERGCLCFTYLGLPLSLSNQKKLISCERRLTDTSSFLNQAGMLELTNFVFLAFPTFCKSIFIVVANL